MKRIKHLFTALLLLCSITVNAQNVEKLPIVITDWENPIQLSQPIDGIRLTFLKNSDSREYNGYPYIDLQELEIFDKNGQKIALTHSLVTSNSVEKSEGSLAGLFDGAQGYYHSIYASGTMEPIGYVFLDIKFPVGIKLDAFTLKLHARSSSLYPKKIAISNYACEYDPLVERPNLYNVKIGNKILEPTNLKDGGLYVISGNRNVNNYNSMPRYYSGVTPYSRMLEAAENDTCVYMFKKNGDGWNIISLSHGMFLNNDAGMTPLPTEAAIVKFAKSNNIDGAMVFYSEINEKAIAAWNGSEYGYNINIPKQEVTLKKRVFIDLENLAVRNCVSEQPGVFEYGKEYLNDELISSGTAGDNLHFNKTNGEGEWNIYEVTMESHDFLFLTRLVSAIENIRMDFRNNPGCIKTDNSTRKVFENIKTAVSTNQKSKAKEMLNTLLDIMKKYNDAELVRIDPEKKYLINSDCKSFYDLTGTHRSIFVNNISNKLLWGLTPETMDRNYIFRFIPISQNEAQEIGISSEDINDAYYICSDTGYYIANDNNSNIIASSDKSLAMPCIVKSKQGTAFTIYNAKLTGNNQLHAYCHGSGAATEGTLVYYNSEYINDYSTWNICAANNYYSQTIGDFLFTKIGEINTLVDYIGDETNIILPDNYKGENYVIGSNVFKNNTSITNLIVSKGVIGIEENAFYGCENLKTIINHSSLTITKGSSDYGYVGYYADKVINAPNGSIEGDWAFGVFDGVNTLLEYLGNDTEIVLPDNYNGENYVIGAEAFYNNTSITSIVIPNSVTSIADNAFGGCTNLKKVELNTTTVENWFSGYTSIKEIVTGSSVTSIAGGAFSGCTNLASLTVGSKVASIGTNAFNGCGNIVKVFWLGNTPPAGYEQLSGKINYVANNQYTNLTGEVVVSQFLSSKFEIDGTVYVPTSLADRTCCIVDYDILSDVSDVAIEETVSYQGVSLKVQDIKPYSFYAKENLETVTFAHDGGIGTSAFEGCDSLENVEIPHTVTFVGDHAFRSCTKLTDAKINNRETVLPLGMQLFANTAIESLYIDSKISYEESDRKISPFSENCTLKSVVITNAESNIYDYEFYNCTALESAVVGDGVEKIGRWAFSGCLNLKDFVFGSNLEEIGEEAFSDCSGLVQITGRAVLPPVCGDQALDDINKWTCKLYVPAVNLDAYQEADQWKEFIFVEELVTTDNYVTYKIDGEVYKILLIKPGERIITPTVDEKEGYTFSGWDLSEYISADGYPVMPAEDIVVEASFYITGIDEVKTEPTVDASQNEKVKTVYDLNGRRIVDAEYLERGVYIVNGKKVVK